MPPERPCWKSGIFFFGSGTPCEFRRLHRTAPRIHRVWRLPSPHSRLTPLPCLRGKRKKAKPPPKKARPKVATVFDCPFCGNSESCSVKMDYEHSQGIISCDQCGTSHESRITRLSEAIDVYAEWIDMCEDVNTNGARGWRRARRRRTWRTTFERCRGGGPHPSWCWRAARTQLDAGSSTRLAAQGVARRR